MVVSFRVYKKTSPNGKMTIYLGRRDFVDHVSETDAVDGVLLVDKDYLAGRQVYTIINSFYLCELLDLLMSYDNKSRFLEIITNILFIFTFLEIFRQLFEERISNILEEQDSFSLF